MNTLYTLITEDGNMTTYYELSDYLFFAFWALLICGFLLSIILCVIFTVRARKKSMKELENYYDEALLVEINASVFKKECFVKSYGVKMPETRKEFYITFLTFQGETKRCSVSEELYLSVDEGTTGTIAFLNDNFFDFYFIK